MKKILITLAATIALVGMGSSAEAAHKRPYHNHGKQGVIQCFQEPCPPGIPSGGGTKDPRDPFPGPVYPCFQEPCPPIPR